MKYKLWRPSLSGCQGWRQVGERGLSHFSVGEIFEVLRGTLIRMISTVRNPWRWPIAPENLLGSAFKRADSLIKPPHFPVFFFSKKRSKPPNFLQKLSFQISKVKTPNFRPTDILVHAPLRQLVNCRIAIPNRIRQILVSLLASPLGDTTDRKDFFNLRGALEKTLSYWTLHVYVYRYTCHYTYVSIEQSRLWHTTCQHSLFWYHLHYHLTIFTPINMLRSFETMDRGLKEVRHPQINSALDPGNNS